MFSVTTNVLGCLQKLQRSTSQNFSLSKKSKADNRMLSLFGRLSNITEDVRIRV